MIFDFYRQPGTFLKKVHKKLEKNKKPNYFNKIRTVKPKNKHEPKHIHVINKE